MHGFRAYMGSWRGSQMISRMSWVACGVSLAAGNLTLAAMSSSAALGWMVAAEYQREVS